MKTPIVEEYREPVFDAQDPLLVEVDPITCYCGCKACKP
jgi:hypothetical protein